MTINVDESAVKRINELKKEQDKPDLMLRITVEGGGCSGFQYALALTEQHGDEDKVFSKTVVTDTLSLGFLEGTTISYKQGLEGSDFIIDNPNAVSGCGCGTSFAV